MKTKIQSASAWGLFWLMGTALAIFLLFGIVFLFTDGPTASVILAGVICVPIGLLFSWLAFAQTLSKIIVTETELWFSVPLYGKRFALAEIEADGIQTANLASDRELRLFLRSNGVGLPGYQLGWFFLRDSRKALAAVTGDGVIIIPTTRGYSLVATVNDAERLVEEIRHRVQAASHPR